MTYEVKTRVFEGPLDLLLQLITSHQVEITDLSLSELVAEYLDYLDVMTAMDLTVTSEFLLIASTLIQLKARHLLPDDRAIDLDDELALAEERDRLLSRLLMNLTFKDVAAVLSHRMAANERHLARSVGLEGVTPTPATDVFAAGGVLYYLVTGRPPVQLAHRHDIAASHEELLQQLADMAVLNLTLTGGEPLGARAVERVAGVRSADQIGPSHGTHPHRRRTGARGHRGGRRPDVRRHRGE